MGLAGASIATGEDSFYIELIVEDSLSSDKFNKITLFNQKGDKTFDFTLGSGDVKKAYQKERPTKRRYHRVRSGETLSHLASRYGCSVSSLKRWNGLRSSRINIGQRLAVSKPIYVKSKTPDFNRFAYLANSEYPDSIFSATLQLEKPVNQLVIKGERRMPSQKEMTFYGVSLENTLQPGILYHSIGVNGSTFYHYNKAALFFDQVGSLNADLIIISLGTNEALSSGFKREQFDEQANAFLEKIKTQFPEASILITTNAAALDKNKRENSENETAREVLLENAKKYDAAAWDLYKIMGGTGSMKEWQAKGIAQSDGVHFVQKAYELQAALLFDALMNGYNAER